MCAGMGGNGDIATSLQIYTSKRTLHQLEPHMFHRGISSCFPFASFRCSYIVKVGVACYVPSVGTLSAL